MLSGRLPHCVQDRFRVVFLKPGQMQPHQPIADLIPTTFRFWLGVLGDLPGELQRLRPQVFGGAETVGEAEGEAAAERDGSSVVAG